MECNQMYFKIRDRLFFLICFFLIFTNIPETLHQNFLGFGGHLSGYPILVGFFSLAWYSYKNNRSIDTFLPDIGKMSIFFLIYLSIICLSTIHGLFVFPYFDKILEGPVNQIDKLPFVHQMILNAGINISVERLTLIWSMVRSIKGTILSVIWSFGISYLIYCWYKNQWKRGFFILLKASCAAVAFVLIYALLDVFYLSGNQLAEWLLTILNPLVHNIKEVGTWYPPLLWKGQLRSLFTEPSYFGIYFAFSMPLFWCLFYREENVRKQFLLILLIGIYTIFLFFTKARTANALLLGEICLLLGISIPYRKIMLKKTLVIVITSLLAFICATGIINFFFLGNKAIGESPSDKMIIKHSKEYLNENLGSLASDNQRSNRARYSIMLTDIKIGLDHPLLGVGNGLRNAYVADYLPEEGLQSAEVRTWLVKQREQGVLKAVVPGLGEYTNRFAVNGILGLLAFLFPAILLMWGLVKNIVRTKDMDTKFIYIFFSISFIGMLACGLGDSINITYCYWVLLGLGYAMCYGRVGDIKENESA
ncbi:O-antigen ligase [uncultured Megasphaera sp.]|uniref:O-antigen ligase family protein n=1 Tax=uncultured Megasphaera sp. TaxID=165188 RepID=UPI00262A2A0D|nr:O-antigen ligase family protein [uncultured Megasphaera sp.]